MVNSYNFQSELLKEAKDRGFIKDITHLKELDEKLSGDKKISLYCGFDLTATSLHIGSLTPIMLLRLFAKYGHKVYLLLGGGTSKIGDPSGKDKERQIMTQETIDTNKSGIKRSLERYFKDSKENIEFVDNAQWLESISYIDFLNEAGRHFTISQMLNLESVKLRLEREQSLSFTEFNYSLLQAYDFAKLNKEYNIELQIGGSDQWGNITSGVDYTRRKNQKEVYGLTMPLLTTADGKKMGKSASGAVWINEDLLPDFEFFQYFRNVQDNDVTKLLRLFTDIPVQEIKERYETITGKEINRVKELLACEVTRLTRGKESADRCLQVARDLFKNNSLSQNMESFEIPINTKLVDAIVTIDKTRSKSQARKLIEANSIAINDEKITDVNYQFTDPLSNVKVSIGKKKHYKVEVI